MGLHLHRYLDAREFTRQLGTWRAYRGEFVGNGLLEELEEARLVIPRLRLRWPDPVARRFFLDSHEGYKLQGPVEPDGPRGDAALALDNALHRWSNHTVYGPSPHPFDDPEPRFAEFLQAPANIPFQHWNDMRVDVSSDQHEVLFADNAESSSTSWQLLLAAEVADMGGHFRVNLAEGDNYRQVWEAIREGTRPGGRASCALLPGHALRDFDRNVRAFDAVIWFEEESERALVEILKHRGGGRYRLTIAENERYHQARGDAATAAAARFNVTGHDLVAAGKFLSKQWSDWKREGRPLTADAYKDFLEATVVMARRLGKLLYADIRDRIGQQGGWFEPILDVIWPDWPKQEKERAARTF